MISLWFHVKRTVVTTPALAPKLLSFLDLGVPMRRMVLVMAMVAGVTLGAGLQGQQEAPTPAPSLTEKGIDLFRARQFVEARKTLARALTANPADAAAHAHLGLVLLTHDRDLDEATSHLERAVEIEPTHSLYLQWLGMVYSRQAAEGGALSAPGFAQKARASLEKAVELHPRDVLARASLMQYFLSVPAAAGGSVAKAREQALAMTEIDRYQGLLAQARIAEREKNDTAAQRLYRSAIAVAPEGGEAYNQLGYLLLRTRRRDEALASFRKYMEVSPGEANPHDSLAEGLLAVGRVDEAITEYRKALDIDPDFSSAHLGLAQCFERKAAWAEAQQALERFLELVPEGRQAEDARTQLARLSKKTARE